MPGIRLSVAMIVRNAAEPLRETLDSIRGLGDEVVALDTGSSDQTVRVAEQCGARVVRSSWRNDFSLARNHCARLARGEWILWLDAGETLQEQEVAQLRQFVQGQADTGKAYALLVKVPQRQSEIGAEQVARVRLVPNLAQLQFTGRVRESLMAALAQQQLVLEALPTAIRRGPREHESEVRQSRAHRNLELASLEIQEQGAQPHLLNCLGESLQILGDDERAEQCFRHALAGSARGSLEMLEAYYGILTSLDSRPDGRPLQQSVCLEALDVFPLDAQLLCAMGGYLQAQGQLELATRAYQTAYQHGTVQPQLWHVDRIQEIAASCYGIGLQLQGQQHEARLVLEQAVSEYPQASLLRRQLMELYIQHGLRDEALAQVAAIPDLGAKRETLRSAVRGGCLVHQKNWIAARAYLQAAYNAGCRETLCLRYLTLVLIALDQRDLAADVLNQWRQHHGNLPEIEKYQAALQQTSTSPTQAPDLGRQLRLDAAVPGTPPAAHEFGLLPTSRTAADHLPQNRQS